MPSVRVRTRSVYVVSRGEDSQGSSVICVRRTLSKARKAVLEHLFKAGLTGFTREAAASLLTYRPEERGHKVIEEYRDGSCDYYLIERFLTK